MNAQDHYDGPTPDPWLPQDEGEQVLDAVEAFLARFVAFPSDEARVATVLWIAHAHVLDCFDSTPRLAFLSPEPGSGKTRALEIVEILSHKPVLTVNATPAYLIRRLAEDDRPVLLFDEIDTVFGPKAKADNEDIRGLINSGYRRGATSGRCVIRGKSVEVEDFPSFAAVCMAGLDDLPDTIATRSVLVRMRRRAPNERIEPFRRRVHERQGHEVRDRLRGWIGGEVSALADAWPELPETIVDRDADVWEPLLAVADRAGGRWPSLARVSAVSLVSQNREERGGLGIRLLADLRTIFAGVDVLGTDEVLRGLHELDEAPWADLKGSGLDARGLSWRLKKYGVGPRQIKALNRKGYRRDDLVDAWTRYLPPEAVEGFPGVSDMGKGDTPQGYREQEQPALVRLPSAKSETAETNETAQAEARQHGSNASHVVNGPHSQAHQAVPSDPSRCAGCGAHLGRAEADAGWCTRCQRIGKASGVRRS